MDAKLVRLAQELKCPLLTNDVNLQKVASLQNVKVLNVNALARAVKPIFLPGEALEILIQRPGKESGQGVGFLDDGTMVVVDAARKKVGSSISCLVTSIVQTASGRMVFARFDPDLNVKLEESPEMPAQGDLEVEASESEKSST